MKTVVPKLQETLFYGTRGDAQLEPCFVLSVPMSPLYPRMTWILILLKNTAPQNLSLISSKNFVINCFQGFTLYVNIKTPNMAILSKQQTLISTISSTKLVMRVVKSSCALVNIFWWILSLKRPESFSITRWKISTKHSTSWSFSQHLKMFSEKESRFWVHCKK